MKYLAKISDKELTVHLQNNGEILEVSVEGEKFPVELKRIGGTNTYSFLMENRSFEVEIYKNETSYVLHHRGRSYKCFVEDERSSRLRKALKQKSPSIKDNEIKSPMPGLVVAIEVAEGQKVTAGQGIIIIEAMKMENEIKAPFDAVVKTIKVKPKQAVEMNQVLIILE